MAVFVFSALMPLALLAHVLGPRSASAQEVTGTRYASLVENVNGIILSLERAGEAQQARKVWRIGLIAVAPRKDQNAVFQGLRELGYVEGENLAIERRYSEGRAERFPGFAAELVQLNVDVILVETTPAALAVKRATRTIPVVFPTAIDPVGAGVVASLARPGANFTGLTTEAPDLVAKRLQLLREVVPRLPH